jgi:lysyl-tRNA synthetase class 2
MDDTNSLIEQRKAKLAALRAKGIDPFKNKFTPGETCADARKNYAEGRETAVAGRITAHREMGKSMFIDVRDQSGRLQIYAQKNHLEETAPGSWDIFTHLDLGDFIGARGKLFTTKTGEISIKLDSFVILAKALRPPPAKWHGLEDTEIRYRQRYLDLMANPEVKDVMLKRSEIIREIRNFLHARGFVEVETPMMQAIPGGAAAQPFKTHHNALGCDFYLRIALELYLKRLLVGGVDKVFEIGRNFRNEGLSRKHNPEFTMLEAYQAFGDYKSMMKLVAEMVTHVAKTVLGTTKIPRKQSGAVAAAIDRSVKTLDRLSADEFLNSIRSQTTEPIARFAENIQLVRRELWDIRNKLGTVPDQELAKIALDTLGKGIVQISAVKAQLNIERLLEPEIGGIQGVGRKIALALRGPLWALDAEIKNPIIDLDHWKEARYKEIVKAFISKDWFDFSPAERRRYAIEDLQLAGDIADGCQDFEITSAVFEKIIEPLQIQPTFVTHLPKELVPLAKLSPDDPTTVEVFECCINGQEIAPAYTEQNDPIEQRERLEHQAGGEQQKLDEDFLVALEHGMPPAGGMGMGIDRLCMMLLGQESIRDVILFPQLKPK